MKLRKLCLCDAAKQTAHHLSVKHKLLIAPVFYLHEQLERERLGDFDAMDIPLDALFSSADISLKAEILIESMTPSAWGVRSTQRRSSRTRREFSMLISLDQTESCSTLNLGFNSPITLLKFPSDYETMTKTSKPSDVPNQKRFCGNLAARKKPFLIVSHSEG